MEKKKYSVVSIHYTTECNMKCPFCYKKKSCKEAEKPKDFWYSLIPKIKEISNQIALGGGEPFINIPFVEEFGKRCKANGVILNVTSNGRALMNLTDIQLKRALKNITLISLSYDDYKVKTIEDLDNYKTLVNRIKKHTNCQVGSNLLINQEMFKDEAQGFKIVVEMLFDKVCVDRVFALCPKNIKCPDILKFKTIYQYLTIKYPHFYIDDLTKMILSEGKYSNWEKECHKGRDLISIDERGGVSSCSFAEPFIFLKNPEELLDLEIPKCEEGLHSCPFLMRK